MKVLHFFKTYTLDSFGGTENFIYQLARGTAQRGLEVDVLTLSPDVRDESRFLENHFVHRVRQNFEIASTGVSFRAFAKFSELARKADVIHYHFPWPFADLVHFWTSVSKPTVVTYHSDILRQKQLLRLYTPLMKRFLNSVDRIVATSPNYLATSDTLTDFRHKTDVIPIGLDRASYPQPSDERIAGWRSRFGERFFLFVGVFRYYKGLHILLDAVRDVDYPVVIVGAGPVEAELRRHAHQAGIDNIHFVGELPEADKIALLILCYAFVFPSYLRSEAFGISLLEGAMFGKPLVSSEIGTGTSYVNIHNETGLVVPPNDPVALRNALTFLMEQPEQAAEMGRRARQRYESYFTAELMVDRYMDLYKELASPRAALPPQE